MANVCAVRTLKGLPVMPASSITVQQVELYELTHEPEVALGGKPIVVVDPQLVVWHKNILQCRHCGCLYAEESQ